MVDAPLLVLPVLAFLMRFPNSDWIGGGSPLMGRMAKARFNDRPVDLVASLRRNCKEQNSSPEMGTGEVLGGPEEAAAVGEGELINLPLNEQF